MELQFQKRQVPCLQQLGCQVLEQEQTMEVRLEEITHQVERVLGVWGQPILRGKEWNSGTVQVSGGVMAWVLYVPEGGSCRVAQTWIPFTWKRDIPPTAQDGTVVANCLLRSADARITGGKKILVRASACLQMQVYVPEEISLPEAEDLPEDVQLQSNSHTWQIPAEAGEKAYVIDEIIRLPAGSPAVDQILCWRIQPELIDKKVMADKVVFRGVGLLKILYLGTDGKVHACSQELSFAQFGGLEGQYGEDAFAQITVGVTGLEATPEPDGSYHVSGNLVGQYVVYEKMEIPVMQDAYSTQRQANLQFTQLQLPVVQGVDTQTVSCKCAVAAQGREMVDVLMLPGVMESVRTEDGAAAEMYGECNLLYYDREGQLQMADGQWSALASVPAEGCQMLTNAAMTGLPQCSWDADGAVVRGELLVDTVCVGSEALETLEVIALTEREQEDEDRPSLILRRAGSESLWQMAKATGSTVEAISLANHLEGEPSPEQILLIPV